MVERDRTIKSIEDLIKDLAIGVSNTSMLVPVLLSRVERLEKDFASIQGVVIEVTRLMEKVAALEEANCELQKQAADDRRARAANRIVMIATVIGGLMGWIGVVAGFIWLAYHK